MIKTFINRPVLSSVISIFIVLLGIIGIYVLPVTQYPDIAPPTINISATYTGSDAETVLQSVIVPIEEQVNGVEGMTYISSKADNNGKADINVYFEQGVNPDIAAVNVQNRVARAIPLLPAEVNQLGVVTQKRQTSALMFATFYSENKAYDDVFIQNYMNINIIPEIKRISGVSDASVFGLRDYSMRVWLDPQKLANFNLIPADVIRVINEQSRQAAPGQIGQNSGKAFQYVIKYDGKYNDVKQYENIIIKASSDGEILRLKDVAKIELSAFSYAIKGETDVYPSLSMAIYQTPGSNAQTIIENIHKYLEKSKSSFPDGLKYTVNYDTNEFLSASMEHVIRTLLEAFVLVFIVVFVFLQDFRSTLIPAIAVPVSIIGAFFFLNVFGFSLNLLTLFAIILAIGIVVDDAIVVVEAVHVQIENKENTGKNMKEITNKAMNGISGAIISITLVMMSVFIPITFIPGPSGIFYKQFGLTLVFAIAISSLNALTLSPMLSALLLKHEKHENYEKQNFLQRFYTAFNHLFKNLITHYGKAIHFLINKKWIAIGLILLSIFAINWASKTTPTGFVPNEDRKIIFADVSLPPGSSFDRTFKVLQSLNEKAKQIPGVKQMSFVAGNSLINGGGSNFGLAFLKLDDWKKRTDKDQSIETITAKLFQVGATIPDARILFFSPPSIPGFGISSGFEAQLLDKSGKKIKELDNVKNKFLMALNQRPEILYAQSPLNTNYPQFKLEMDMTLAKLKGVSPADVFSTLNGYIGGSIAGDFIKYGKYYRVMIQAAPSTRASKEDLNAMSVRNNLGEMIPITQFATLKKTNGPQSVSRFNLFNSAAISGAPKPGYSTGDAITAVQEVAAKELPDDFDIGWSGLTREEINSGSQTGLIFTMTIIFVFLLLAAQYESYILPFSILFSLPLGIMGAFLSQKLLGLENNIYFQIALVMLIGLLAKNAILIVEFALQERYKGNSIIQAAILGAEERLRPILMTSFAFILGLMPLVVSSGIGANGNRSLATGAALGMLIGTSLGVLVIPVMFTIFQTIQEKIKPIKFNDIKQN
ncbi:efflux RND transporter permease subunit [Tenacibaculum sp. UWU-22]|uniref:efflux RND transporter permease subunit n=1 Tax=Tenacibaculum sp. UWU-22 TaxID=3234187 RepID=UPI0034DB4A2E